MNVGAKCEHRRFSRHFLAISHRKLILVLERFVYPDFTFEAPVGEEDFRQALVEHFPEERTAIARYFADVRRAVRWFRAYVVAQTLPGRLSGIVRRILAPLERLALSTTGTYLARRFRDPRLRALLASQWGDYGLPPGESAFGIHALIVAHYLDGGYYPAGGAEVIAQSVRSIVEAYGGECRLNHRVTEILVEDGRAIGVKAIAKHGRSSAEVEFRAPVIVSDAGAYTTFCRLLPETTRVPFRPWMEEMLPDASFVTLYLGLKESPARLGFRGENHWLFTGSDHDELFRRRNEILQGRPAFCYLSFPSLKDPAATYHTAEAIAPMDYAAVRAWAGRPWRRRGPDYEALKARIAEGLLDLIEAHIQAFESWWITGKSPLRSRSRRLRVIPTVYPTACRSRPSVTASPGSDRGHPCGGCISREPT